MHIIKVVVKNLSLNKIIIKDLNYLQTIEQNLFNLVSYRLKFRVRFSKIGKIGALVAISSKWATRSYYKLDFIIYIIKMMIIRKKMVSSGLNFFYFLFFE